MAANATDPCPCGREPLRVCDACHEWYCASCMDLDGWTQEEIARDVLWCPPCQATELASAQMRLSERSRASQDAIERCLRTRSRVRLTDPSTPRTLDEIARRVRRLHSLLRLEGPARDDSGDARFFVVRKRSGVTLLGPWHALSLVAVDLLNVPTFIDPPGDAILDVVDAARATNEPRAHALRRLAREGRVDRDEAQVVPSAPHVRVHRLDGAA